MTPSTDWMANAAEHHDLTEAQIADLSRPRFVRPDADPMAFADDMDGGAKVIAWMAAIFAVYGFLAISAAHRAGYEAARADAAKSGWYLLNYDDFMRGATQ